VRQADESNAIRKRWQLNFPRPVSSSEPQKRLQSHRAKKTDRRSNT